MGIFRAIKMLQDSANRETASEKADEVYSTLLSLEQSEVNITRATFHHPAVDAYLLALRKSIEAWKKAHIAYKTTANCQKNVDAAFFLSQAAHRHAIATHNELRQVSVDAQEILQALPEV